MQQHKTTQLYDKDAAVAFYEERFAHGYMDDWPTEKKRRVLEVIRNYDLPDVGEVLDFGCGNGVFTDVIKQALPAGWKVYGTDISENAIENAKKRYPGCVFFLADDREFKNRRFDFLLTHHVLEHVYDMPQVLTEMTARLKGEAAMLHILPCGNEGSLEQRICALRKDGINRQLENRFFFEEEGHLRRLTTEQLSNLCGTEGFVLAGENYSNQYYGAIDWITQYGPSVIRMLTDVTFAIDERAERELTRMRYKFYLLWGLRYPAAVVDRRLNKKGKKMRDYIALILGLPLYVFSKAIDTVIRGKTLNEWKSRKAERNGSEMYLFFKR